MIEPTVVTAAGELDVSVAQDFAMRVSGAVEESTIGPVVIDLSEVTFIDSTGLSALLNAHRRLTSQGRALHVIARPGGAVRRTLWASRLEDTLGVRDRLDETLAEYGSPS